MNWIADNWQSLAAAAVVAVTAAVFVLRGMRRRTIKPPCGRDCGCGKQ